MPAGGPPECLAGADACAYGCVESQTATDRYATRSILPSCESATGCASSLRVGIMDNSYFLRLATDDEPRSPTARRSIQRRTTWHPQRLSSTILSALFLALVATTPALAARIPFQNCLPDSYRLNDPTPLQWVPLYADAVFDTVDDSHELQVVVWGNVTGSRNNAALPAANDSYWEDDSETNGKIIQTENPGAQGSKATTLARKIDVLTFEPWSNRVDFCASGLTNASCPLSPVFSVDGM